MNKGLADKIRKTQERVNESTETMQEKEAANYQ